MDEKGYIKNVGGAAGVVGCYPGCGKLRCQRRTRVEGSEVDSGRRQRRATTADRVQTRLAAASDAFSSVNFSLSAASVGGESPMRSCGGTWQARAILSTTMPRSRPLPSSFFSHRRRIDRDGEGVRRGFLR